MTLGPHAFFIWTCYGVVTFSVIALIAWLLWDGKRQLRALSELEAKGVRRRSKSQ